MGEDRFKYVGIVNLTIDHVLTKEELKTYQDLLFSPNTIKQIDFLKGVDLSTILYIKYYLELSSYIIDERITKMILVDDSSIRKEIVKLHFENPLTWNLSYAKVKDEYQITNITNYKIYLDNIYFLKRKIKVKNKKTKLEIIKEIYNYFRKYKINKEDDLMKVITNKKGSINSLNKAFSIFLNEFNIINMLFKTEKGNLVAIPIKDSKYHLFGLYLFSLNHIFLVSPWYFQEKADDKLLPPLSLTLLSKKEALREFSKIKDQYPKITNFSNLFERVNKTK